MSTLERITCAAAHLLLAATAIAQSPNLGQPVAPAEFAIWDISIGPDGAGLPPGRGSVAEGRAVYVAKCQSCHGERGAGGPNDALAGGLGSLAAGKAPLKTVGSYWPYATTLFDYIRRAMPFPEPKSLTADETYALSAYILHLSDIVGPETALDARSLAAVQMPNRAGFVPFPRNPK